RESGLYCVRNRMYSNRLGKWLARDAIRHSKQASLYEYAQSNAARYTDPKGLFVCRLVSWVESTIPAVVRDCLCAAIALLDILDALSPQVAGFTSTLDCVCGVLSVAQDYCQGNCTNAAIAAPVVFLDCLADLAQFANLIEPGAGVLATVLLEVLFEVIEFAISMVGGAQVSAIVSCLKALHGGSF
ncbi:MAG: hypothetical protein KDA59_00440, partial [Planctomycetales bacterium]|nr:hypothetical protein [Planctomycetales bacterium]